MKYYDIFNGDADGICALHQLRLTQPREAVLITGVKRDLRLVERADAEAGDELTVLDVSMQDNAEALQRLLARGVRCQYFDHHYPGDIPSHPALHAVIDTSPDVCTSLLVDRHLGGSWRPWAVVAAFGDNLDETARAASAPLQLSAERVDQLAELGRLLNYNGYGERIDDLVLAPAELYRRVSRFQDPFAFIEEEPAFGMLRQSQAEDQARAAALRPYAETATAAVYVLPNEPWSRRLSGTVANDLARERRERAHAVLVAREGGYTVSVRAPRARPLGADALCRRFPTGGGRAAAAGINLLAASDLDRFVAEFQRAF
jgi:single-stranded DNA-specific DHH superfamily exonuclease